MRIAFLGSRPAFDYHQIGGVESFIRRLSGELVRGGESVDYVMIGGSKSQSVTSEGVCLKYFPSLWDACNTLVDSYDHVVTVYLPPQERLAYCAFRVQKRKQFKFHSLLFDLTNAPIKRMLKLLDTNLCYDSVFAVSPRISAVCQRWGQAPVLLLPPVPKGYFLRTEDKKHGQKIRMTFVGRVDLGKGIKEVIDLFLELGDRSDVETQIYGYYSAGADTANSRGIYEWLKGQARIKYVDANHKAYTPQVERRLRTVLRETDVLLLPYRRLGSTIDTPLLLLEGMASLCAIVTRRMGSIPSIYGESEFLIPEGEDVKYVRELLPDISSRLKRERARIDKRNRQLGFCADRTAQVFREALSKQV
jgi:glycosyltransferase involved in cell wall biosynthesis